MLLFSDQFEDFFREIFLEQEDNNNNNSYKDVPIDETIDILVLILFLSLLCFLFFDLAIFFVSPDHDETLSWTFFTKKRVCNSFNKAKNQTLGNHLAADNALEMRLRTKKLSIKHGRIRR